MTLETSSCEDVCSMAWFLLLKHVSPLQFSPPERSVQQWYNEGVARQRMCQTVGKWLHLWQWSHRPARHIEGNRHKSGTNRWNYVGKLMSHNFRVSCCSGIVTQLYSILTMKKHNTMKQPDFYHDWKFLNSCQEGTSEKMCICRQDNLSWYLSQIFFFFSWRYHPQWGLYFTAL